MLVEYMLLSLQHQSNSKSKQRHTLISEMSHSISPSLITLPIECVYRILDHLDPLHILLSMREVCLRLNAITDTYQPYTVKML